MVDAAHQRVAVVTGGRSHYPSCRELEAVASLLAEHEIGVLRHGDAKGVDRLVGGYIRARGLAEVEKWPANWHPDGPGTRVDRSAGARRNRLMLDGGTKDMFGRTEKGQADLLIALRGGTGTTDCKSAAESRKICIAQVEPVAEPRPWNRHHGEPPGPSAYVGQGTPLGNPFRGDIDHEAGRAAAAGPVLMRYRRWLWDRICPGSPDYDADAVAMLDSFTPEHFVVCSCWPAHCHAEYVVAAWRFRVLLRERGLAQ